MRLSKLAFVAGLGLFSGSAMAQDWLRAFPEGVVAFDMAVVAFLYQDILSVETKGADGRFSVRVKFSQDLARAFSSASKGKSPDKTVVYLCGKAVPGNPVVTVIRGSEIQLETNNLNDAEVLATYLLAPPCSRILS